MRRAVWWVLGVVVVLVLAVVGDRVAQAVAEGRVESDMRAQGTADAQVSLGGFPFLPELVRGRLDDVTGSAASATVQGDGDALEVTDVRFEAHDVATSAPYVAAEGTASALVPATTLTAAVAARTGLDLTVAVEPSDDGTGVLTVSGLGDGLAVTVVPRADGDAVAVDVSGVKLGPLEVGLDDLPGAIGDRVTEAVSDLRIPLGLPDGITLTSVEADPEGDGGVRVELSAQEVPLADLALRSTGASS